jgi:tRNA nucleotidyltransferase/poly(A) polymerase
LLEKIYWLHWFVEKLNLFKSNLYFFGGTVRDVLRNQQPRDFDLVYIGENLFEPTREVAAYLGRVAVIKENFKYLKIIPSERKDLAIDIVFAEDLDHFLRHRDFTINSMAVQFNSSVALFCLGDKRRLIDPNNGYRDLKKGLLRTCSPDSFKEDPVRILRAANYLATGEFHALPEVYQQAMENAIFLAQISTSRLRENFLNLAFQSRPSYFFWEINKMAVDRLVFGIETSSSLLKLVASLEKQLLSRDLSFAQKKALKIAILHALGFTDVNLFKNYFSRKSLKAAKRFLGTVIY